MKKLILVLILPMALFAYTPGKWSHLDEYILQGKPNGPVREEVKNNQGRIIYIAEYQYNAKGQLIRETYINEQGMPDGSSVFTYKDDRVIGEQLVDARGETKEKKVFQYNGNRMQKVLLHMQENIPELVCHIHAYINGTVSQAETRWIETEDTEKFNIIPDPENPLVWKQTVWNNQNEKEAEIIYEFNSKKQLVVRTHTKKDLQRRNELYYNAQGQLERFSFHVKRGQGWELEKTHYLFYSNNGKALVD